MKNVYALLLIISALCITGDCDSFVVWMLWEIIWFAVFVFSSHKLIEDRS